MEPTNPSQKAPATGTDERRHLTVLFSDLCGSTQLGHDADPEVLDEVLQHVKDAAFEVIARYDGTVIQFHGDGVLAVFGYPAPREDDVRRATHAALDLHEAVRALDLRVLLPAGFELRMHSGIDSGLALVREGDAVLGRFEVVGDPPNTAAGLASAAGADQILASKTALLGSLPFFECETIEPVALKGIAEPVDAYRVEARSGITRRFEASRHRGLTPFIGRTAAIEALESGLERARHGQFSLARVVGDAGIGKTRTVEEFLRTARNAGHLVLTGYCEMQGSIAPLWPFQQILRQAFDLTANPAIAPDAAALERRLDNLGLHDQAAEIMGFLNIQPSGHLAETAVQGGPHVIAATAALLGKLSSNAPLVLFIDDWQWSDDTSRALAAELHKALADRALLWISATRPTDTSNALRDNEILIELEPFCDAESAQAIEALSPSGLDLGLAARLHQRSGGNPLFLEELCRTLGSDDAQAQSALDVPATLHGLIEDRVHALPKEHTGVLRIAAVIGNVVPLWLLLAVTGLDQDSEVLADLAALDLLYAGSDIDTLRFTHGITRDAIYHAVKLADRRRLHAEIATTLEARYAEDAPNRPLETLAYHYDGSANYLRASELAELAGDRAWVSAALDRTRQQYGAALAALDRLEQTEEVQRRWLAISKRRAFACVFNPAREQINMLNRAAQIGEALGDSSAVGHAHFWAGFISYSLGDLADSIDQYKTGLVVAESSGDRKLVVQLRANLGESRAATCEYEDAVLLLDESIESKRKLQSSGPGSSAPTGSAFAFACKGFIAADRGDVEEAEQFVNASLEAVRGTGHPVAGSCLAFKTTGLVLLGRFEEAAELGTRVQALGGRMNGPFIFGRGRADRSFARFMLRGDRDALETLRATTDWLEEKEIRLYISISQSCVAEAMVRADQLELARRYAEKALKRADELDRIGEGMACRALARVSERESPNQPEIADAYLARAYHVAASRSSARERALTKATEAEIFSQRGERDLARERLSEAQVELERMDLSWYAAHARRLAVSLSRA